MKKILNQKALRVNGGAKSYGAGRVCVAAFIGTILVTIASGTIGLISMGSVTGTACGFGIRAA